MRGRLFVTTIANPAAGADFTITVPAAKRWRPLSLKAHFVTSATVASRSVRLSADDGATVFMLCGEGNISHAASQAVDFEAAHIGTRADGSANFGNLGLTLIPLPAGLELGPGYRLFTTTAAIQAGDQYSAIAMLVEEWDA